ncbi:hypothetical protein GCL60_01900 [Silvanigrella paludirubra]|uniref:Tetratricopeptide repeat protein n=1 Tax=Silvanigrella paludirubra TaxID=2499159 RepID=A0A6N6VZG8_9BACT|nr:hypothetical protein [Silvanigrella paludirubra]KAB8040702.1 hypothetical protein GCL60_01900 [Silvanigrella paludirubra]
MLKIRYLLQILKLIYFIFLLFSLNNGIVFAQEWPSLFINEDIIPQNKSELKQIKKLQTKDIQKMPQEKIREKILNSFYFIADFISSTKQEEPKNWFDSHKNPDNSLKYGFPPELKRPPLTIYYPAYNLTKLAYFVTENPYISKLNVCQGFWAENRLQFAYDCFFFLQLELANDKIPINSLERLQVNLLHAFFLLHLATNDVTNVHIWNPKTAPPIPQDFTEGDHYAISRVLFSYISTQVDDTIYLPKQKTDIIEPIYKNIFESPVYFRVTAKVWGNKTSVTLLKDPIDPLKWVQTVMPLAYANTMAMNQGIMLWQRAFNSAQKIENYFQNFNYPKMSEDSPLIVKSPSLVKNEIFIAPKNNTDFLAATDLFRATAMLIAKDPAKSLEYISSGILRKGHPEISALMFNLSGNAYFDLDLLRWARRSYSWAELFSKSFAEKVPSSLIYGGESAYWYGKYDVAQKSYERFLKLIGDPEFSPWAYLRLAEIEERKGNSNNAKNYYEVILRKFNSHFVAADAQVRLFCLYQNGLTKNTKKVEYQKVVEKIKNSRDVLKKQAKACMLKVDLENLQEDSAKDTKTTVVEKSLKQKEAIDKYAKEFPDSEFLVLFTDRIKELELSVGTFLASENACNKLIEYYLKNKDSLVKLKNSNHHYVNGLKWGNDENLKLLRCSAFINNVSLWKEMRKTEIGKDGEPLHTFFYNLSQKPSVENALLAYSSLKKSSDNWVKKVKTIEKSSFEAILKEDFWEMLTLRELMKFDLLTSKSANNLLNNAVSQDLFNEPKLIYSSNTFCYWMLRSSSQFNSEKWESIAKTKDKKEWLNLLTDKKNEQKMPCETAFAKALFTVSLRNPTVYLDSQILLPFLEKQGIDKGAEDWLQYVQRIEKERGNKDQEVQAIYRKLLKEAKEPLVKEAAGMWIKKNIPEEADKLLW